MPPKTNIYSHSTASTPPIAYSCWLEVQLEFDQNKKKNEWGESRAEHNKICNQKLLVLLDEFDEKKEQLLDGVSNDILRENIRLRPRRAPHSSLVWEHCSTSTARNIRGVMRLVPKEQHNPKSKFWRIIHPDYKNSGGYHEWALPAGAPAPLPKK